MEIGEILARRNDLSTFLVHLCRDRPHIIAAKALASILADWRIEAETSFGSAVRRFAAVGGAVPDSQKAVCFTETPLEHISLLTKPISGRDTKLEPYGIAIPKKVGRLLAINPVWYLDITPRGGVGWLTAPLNALIDQAIAAGFAGSHMERLAPFIEQMGTKPPPGAYRKEFWWEREWRHTGHLDLPERIIILCPEKEIPPFTALTALFQPLKKVVFLDPEWGLEQIVGRLAGYSAAETDIL